eukprot:g1267.t1
MNHLSPERERTKTRLELDRERTKTQDGIFSSVGRTIMAPMNALVTRLARKFLQKYVKIDFQQVRYIQLSKIVFDITGVEFQENAFAAYDVPVEISAGVVRRLVLTIPFSFFGGSSEPTLLLDDLYLIAKPHDSFHHTSDEKVAKSEEAKKKGEKEKKKHEKMWAKLQAEEERYLKGSHLFRRVKEGLDAHNEATYEALNQDEIEEHSFLDNIKVTLNRIHIQYEDSLTADLPFTMGLAVDRVEYGRANVNKANAVNSNDHVFSRKEVRIEGFRIYLNSCRIAQLKPSVQGKNYIRELQNMLTKDMAEAGYVKPRSPKKSGKGTSPSREGSSSQNDISGSSIAKKWPPSQRWLREYTTRKKKLYNLEVRDGKVVPSCGLLCAANLERHSKVSKDDDWYNDVERYYVEIQQKGFQSSATYFQMWSGLQLDDFENRYLSRNRNNYSLEDNLIQHVLMPVDGVIGIEKYAGKHGFTPFDPPQQVFAIVLDNVDWNFTERQFLHMMALLRYAKDLDVFRKRTEFEFYRNQYGLQNQHLSKYEHVWQSKIQEHEAHLSSDEEDEHKNENTLSRKDDEGASNVADNLMCSKLCRDLWFFYFFSWQREINNRKKKCKKMFLRLIRRHWYFHDYYSNLVHGDDGQLWIPKFDMQKHSVETELTSYIRGLEVDVNVACPIKNLITGEHKKILEKFMERDVADESSDIVNWRTKGHYRINIADHRDKCFSQVPKGSLRKSSSFHDNEHLSIADVISCRQEVRHWLVIKFLLFEYISIKRKRSGTSVAEQDESDGTLNKNNHNFLPVYSKPSLYNIKSQYACASPNSIRRRISIFLKEGRLALKTMSGTWEKFSVMGTSFHITSRIHPLSSTRLTLHCSDIKFNEIRSEYVNSKSKDATRMLLESPSMHVAPQKKLLTLLDRDNIEKTATMKNSYTPSLEEILLHDHHRHNFFAFLEQWSEFQSLLNEKYTQHVENHRVLSNFVVGSVLIWIRCQMHLSVNQLYYTSFIDFLVLFASKQHDEGIIQNILVLKQYLQDEKDKMEILKPNAVMEPIKKCIEFFMLPLTKITTGNGIVFFNEKQKHISLEFIQNENGVDANLDVSEIFRSNDRSVNLNKEGGLRSNQYVKSIIKAMKSFNGDATELYKLVSTLEHRSWSDVIKKVHRSFINSMWCKRRRIFVYEFPSYQKPILDNDNLKSQTIVISEPKDSVSFLVEFGGTKVRRIGLRNRIIRLGKQQALNDIAVVVAPIRVSNIRPDILDKLSKFLKRQEKVITSAKLTSSIEKNDSSSEEESNDDEDTNDGGFRSMRRAHRKKRRNVFVESLRDEFMTIFRPLYRAYRKSLPKSLQETEDGVPRSKRSVVSSDLQQILSVTLHVEELDMTIQGDSTLDDKDDPKAKGPDRGNLRLLIENFVVSSLNPKAYLEKRASFNEVIMKSEALTSREAKAVYETWGRKRPLNEGNSKRMTLARGKEFINSDRPQYDGFTLDIRCLQVDVWTNEYLRGHSSENLDTVIFKIDGIRLSLYTSRLQKGMKNNEEIVSCKSPLVKVLQFLQYKKYWPTDIIELDFIESRRSIVGNKDTPTKNRRTEMERGEILIKLGSEKVAILNHVVQCWSSSLKRQSINDIQEVKTHKMTFKSKRSRLRRNRRTGFGLKTHGRSRDIFKGGKKELDALIGSGYSGNSFEQLGIFTTDFINRKHVRRWLQLRDSILDEFPKSKWGGRKVAEDLLNRIDNYPIVAIHAKLKKFEINYLLDEGQSNLGATASHRPKQAIFSFKQIEMLSLEYFYRKTFVCEINTLGCDVVQQEALQMSSPLDEKNRTKILWSEGTIPSLLNKENIEFQVKFNAVKRESPWYTGCDQYALLELPPFHMKLSDHQISTFLSSSRLYRDRLGNKKKQEEDPKKTTDVHSNDSSEKKSRKGKWPEWEVDRKSGLPAGLKLRTQLRVKKLTLELDVQQHSFEKQNQQELYHGNICVSITPLSICVSNASTKKMQYPKVTRMVSSINCGSVEVIGQMSHDHIHTHTLHFLHLQCRDDQNSKNLNKSKMAKRFPAHHRKFSRNRGGGGNKVLTSSSDPNGLSIILSNCNIETNDSYSGLPVKNKFALTKVVARRLSFRFGRGQNFEDVLKSNYSISNCRKLLDISNLQFHQLKGDFHVYDVKLDSAAAAVDPYTLAALSQFMAFFKLYPSFSGSRHTKAIEDGDKSKKEEKERETEIKKPKRLPFEALNVVIRDFVVADLFIPRENKEAFESMKKNEDQISQVLTKKMISKISTPPSTDIQLLKFKVDSHHQDLALKIYVSCWRFADYDIIVPQWNHRNIELVFQTSGIVNDVTILDYTRGSNSPPLILMQRKESLKHIKRKVPMIEITEVVNFVKSNAHDPSVDEFVGLRAPAIQKLVVSNIEFMFLNRFLKELFHMMRWLPKCNHFGKRLYRLNDDIKKENHEKYLRSLIEICTGQIKRKPSQFQYVKVALENCLLKVPAGTFSNQMVVAYLEHANVGSELLRQTPLSLTEEKNTNDEQNMPEAKSSGETPRYYKEFDVRNITNLTAAFQGPPFLEKVFDHTHVSPAQRAKISSTTGLPYHKTIAQADVAHIVFENELNMDFSIRTLISRIWIGLQNGRGRFTDAEQMLLLKLVKCNFGEESLHLACRSLKSGLPTMQNIRFGATTAEAEIMEFQDRDGVKERVRSIVTATATEKKELSTCEKPAEEISSPTKSKSEKEIPTSSVSEVSSLLAEIATIASAVEAVRDGYEHHQREANDVTNDKEWEEAYQTEKSNTAMLMKVLSKVGGKLNSIVARERKKGEGNKSELTKQEKKKSQGKTLELAKEEKEKSKGNTPVLPRQEKKKSRLPLVASKKEKQKDTNEKDTKANDKDTIKDQMAEMTEQTMITKTTATTFTPNEVRNNDNTMVEMINHPEVKKAL